MHDLINRTPYQAMLFPALTREGDELCLVIVKGTFTFGAGRAAVEPAGEQVPVMAADVPYGDPATSSAKYEADTSPPKPGTDVVLVGQAHSDKAVTELDVGLSVGPVRQVLRVFGDRVWYQGPLGWTPTAPKPFRSMPLTYERAFGGQDAVVADKAKAEPRNPVGTGFVGAGGKDRIEHLPLPNLEDPANLIGSPSDRPAPVGMGFVGRHWAPRSAFVGTYDEQWREERAPLLPLDFDERFYNGAPEALVARPHLRGGEPVRLLGCSPEARVVDFRLPAVKLQVEAVIRGATRTAAPVLDTVVIEPDERRVALTWRAAVPCTRNYLHVERVTVAAA
ncbi:MAG TPA: DUF2169 domain-containing protein [Myxococcaceae bacterium]|nr:DUF2169 domain-containing protein [Myxococcaceae bacterium]